MDEKQKKHNKTKLILKIVGIVVAVAGLALAATGIGSMFASDGFPELFWMAILGLPMLGIGLMITLAAFRREIASYSAREAAPVVNEMSEAVSPAIQTVAKAAKDGLTQTEKASAVCPACGAQNDADAKFCDNCGKALKKECPACGTQNDVDAKFCDNCGGPLGE